MTGPASDIPESWSNRRWWAWGFLPILAVALALGVQMQPAGSAAAEANRALFLLINQAGTYGSATAWSSVTMLGDASLLLALLSPLLLVRPQAVAAVLAAAPLGGLLSVIFKRTFDAPRPAGVLDAAQFHVIGPVLSQHSFPSGHTIAAFSVAVAVLAVLQRPAEGREPSGLRVAGIFVAAIGLASLVGISRIAVGAHWPVDVLAGAACGWLAGLSGAAASRRWPMLWQGVRSRWGLMGVLIGVAAWLLWRPVDYPLGAPVVWLSVASVAITAVALWVRARQS